MGECNKVLFIMPFAIIFYYYYFYFSYSGLNRNPDRAATKLEPWDN